LRTERGILREKKRRGEITVKEEVRLATLAGAAVFAESAEATAALPQAFKNIVKNPKILKQIPGAIKLSGEEFGQLIRVSPGEALIVVGANVFLLKGSSAVISSLAKGVTKGTTKLSTKFVGTASEGKKLNIQTAPGKSISLDVVSKIPKQTLKKQVQLQGQRVTAISSQADRLIGVIKKEKLLRKPIPGEATFNPTTKRLLRKFDKGTISKKQLLQLDTLIQKQGAKGLLERSFFADPTGKIRPSRLGILEEKRKKLPVVESIVDKLTDDITFKQAKPQILLFEDVKVAKLPKSLASVKRKLSKGQTLTKKEADDLLKFQLRKSTKFKPIGFVSKEAEITLSPGQIIRKVKTVGVTIIKGRRVPIIKTEVFKPKGQTKKLLTQFQKGKKPLTKKQQKQLDKLLKKQTGFDFGVTSSSRVGKRFVDIKRIGLSSLSKVRRRPSRPSKPSKVSRRPIRPSRPSKPSKPSRPSRPSKPSKPSKVSPLKVSKPSLRKPPISPPRKPPIKPPIKPRVVPPIKLKKKRRPKKKRKPQQAFNVTARPRRIKGEKRPKLIKINQVPLSRKNARNLRNKVLDTTLARTGSIRPTTGKPRKPLLRVNKNFAKSSKNKFRDFRIVKGKRVKLRKGKVIEKSRFLLDTKSEKRSITLSKKLAQLKKQAGKPKRILSPKQLRALSNGRKKLQNLRKKK